MTYDWFRYVAVVLALVCAGTEKVHAEIREPLAIGEAFPDFTLPDITGREHRLSDYQDKIVVFTFCTPECPCSRSVDGALAELAAAYADRDVVFLGVNSNFFMDPESLRDYAASVGVKFPILKDDDEVLANATGARVTPEVFIKDKHGKVVFHGPPDNRANPKAVPTEFYLKDALEALTTGRPVTKSNITPWGCSIRAGSSNRDEEEHKADEDSKQP